MREKSGLPVFNTIIRHSKKVKRQYILPQNANSLLREKRSGTRDIKNFILEYMNKPHMAAEQKERG